VSNNKGFNCHKQRSDQYYGFNQSVVGLAGYTGAGGFGHGQRAKVNVLM
jgi:hypothetical protein